MNINCKGPQTNMLQNVWSKEDPIIKNIYTKQTIENAATLIILREN